MAVNEDFRGAVNPPPCTVTAAERDKLAELRARPKPQQQLVPKGVVRVDTEAIARKLRESRIRHIDQRLMLADHKMRRDRLNATSTGRAKAGFNHKAKTNDNERSR